MKVTVFDREIKDFEYEEFDCLKRAYIGFRFRSRTMGRNSFQ